MSVASSPPRANGLKLAPGPSDPFYLLKRLPQSRRNVLELYDEAWGSWGDMVRFSWPKNHQLYLCIHPQMVERVLQANWQNYPKGFFYGRLSIFTGQGLFTSNGELWLTQRRLVQPAFHRARIDALCELMGQTVEEMLARWDESEFDLNDEMMRLTLQVAGRALFGADLAGEAAQRFHALMNAAMEHVEHRFNPLTWPESVPTPRNLRYLRVKAELDSWVISLVKRRRSGQERGEDVLQLLVEARDENGDGISDAQLIDETLTLLVAGHETTADALSWAFALLAKNPDWREKLEIEAKNVLGARLPNLEDLENLPIARQIFDETLRLYPPIWTLARQAKNADEIGGFKVEAGATVIVPPMLTHRHPDFWPEPEKFDPTRFTPENVAQRPKFAYFPFGGGPRLCVGQSFALMEGQIALSMIAARFRLELVGAFPEVHPMLALRPRGGLKMKRKQIQ